MDITKATQKYLEWKATHTIKAPSTYELHLKRFSQFTKFKILENIKLDDIIKFQLLLKIKYSMANVAYSMVILKNFFEFWKRQNIKCLDPFLIKIPKFIPKSHATVTYEEYIKLDEVIRENDFYELERKVIVRILWETGMRVGELCDLNVSNLEEMRPSALIRTKKNNQMRWVFWGVETHRLLMKYLGIRIHINQTPALFIASEKGSRNERITTRTIQRWIKEIVERAEINKKISPHSFRHGKAHYILSKGGNVAEIAKLLGHSDNNPRAAFSYLKLSDLEIKKIAQRFLD